MVWKQRGKGKRGVILNRVVLWGALLCAVMLCSALVYQVVLYGGIVWRFGRGNRKGMTEGGFPVRIESCRIDREKGEVAVTASAQKVLESDDKYYYLFALQVYDEGLIGGQTYLRRERKGEKVEFKTEFHKENGLFRKYVVAVVRNGEYVAVSRPHYITNPEELAVFVSNGERPEGKKGLLIDPEKLLSAELEELGVKHAAYNIPVSRILGHDGEDVYEAVHYTYHGQDYVFNGRAMSEYDLVFRTLTQRGIEVTAILLNDAAQDYPWLVHPLARSGIGGSPYYAFNAGDGQGVECLAAVGSFLAERYSGVMNGRGVVSNWVIGNEVNARKEWNYMEHVDLETYVREYVRAYRVFYQAIKSVNSACRVYISLDNQWNRVNLLTGSYRAKDVLDEFNRQVKEEGNIDWGLAIHPYNKPLTKVETWEPSVYVKETEDTPVVTMANIHVVTDYMRQKEFLTDAGQVRSITLSELGYTSSKGEKLQAAAIVYAYRMAAANPYIDAVLFSRQTDAEAEIEKLDLYLGLDGLDGAHKYAYEAYKHMDREAGNFCDGCMPFE